MARFDVYTFKGGVPFVIDVQAELFSDIGSRVVVPLMPAIAAQKEAMPRLKPLLHIDGTDYRMVTTDLVAIPCSLLGERIANLDAQRQVIIDAIDFLLQGF